MFKSVKLSITGKGMVYVCFFVLASSIYIVIFSIPLVLMNMITLSFIAITASILSDKKIISQYISVLTLSGARRKLILSCIRVYTLIRILPTLLTFTIYSIYSNLYLVALVVNIAYASFMILLPYVVYKGVRK